jgi:hypothetical protein
MNVATASILGALAGMAYFAEGERGIPKESNCTYLSPATTDVAAWLGGAYLVYQGAQLNSPGVAFCGACIASLHASQYGAHKAITRPSLRELAHDEEWY